MKKVTIIGANGYIGRNLVQWLRQKDDSELYLYGRADEQADHVPDYTKVDMLQSADLHLINLQSDVIFMLAGKTGSMSGFDDYEAFIDANEKTLLNLLAEYRRQGSTARIVFPSTRLVYAGSKKTLNEEAAKLFHTVYAVNKWACEKYLEQFHHAFGIEYSIFRICVPYGSLVAGCSSYGTASFMLNRACQGQPITLYGDGEQRRTLTYIGDVCRILVEGAFSGTCADDVFNIGGETFSLREMAEMIAAKYEVPVQYMPWPDLAKKIESGSTVFDATKLEATLGREEHYMRFADWLAKHN